MSHHCPRRIENCVGYCIQNIMRFSATCNDEESFFQNTKSPFNDIFQRWMTMVEEFGCLLWSSSNELYKVISYTSIWSHNWSFQHESNISNIVLSYKIIRTLLMSHKQPTNKNPMSALTFRFNKQIISYMSVFQYSWIRCYVFPIS